MQAQRRADTAPEIKLRKELFHRGLRYRLGIKVPGQPRRTIDIAFPKRQVAVFVDGCFWHLCPEHSFSVTNNAEWWRLKLEANAQRDLSTTMALHNAGWTVLRFWEHHDVALAADAVEAAVRQQPGTSD